MMNICFKKQHRKTFFKQIIYANSLQICWMCEADKSISVMNYAYNGPDATWKQTMYCSSPCFAHSSLLDLHGFTLRNVFPDLLHCFFLGTGRDIIGSSMKLLIRYGFFEGNNIPAKLKDASKRFRLWREQNHVTTSLKKFSKYTAGIDKAKKYPEARCKGAAI